ncbi:Fur-regulated basic protein FbpA [Terrilactibacillus sp. S3-3]|nr:Fur-regulated basic protein FbpA [Terrilactibacillus sp. S3-3]
MVTNLETKSYQAIEKRKNELIDRLIKHGVYKKGGRHLYSLSLNDLENEWKIIEHSAL